jgi:RNA recognition motif-containing protein
MRDDDKYPTIRVTNVSEDTTDEDLKQLFGRFGEWDPWHHQALWPTFPRTDAHVAPHQPAHVQESEDIVTSGILVRHHTLIKDAR